MFKTGKEATIAYLKLKLPRKPSDLIQKKTQNKYIPQTNLAPAILQPFCGNDCCNIPPAQEIHFHSMSNVLLSILFCHRKGLASFLALRNWHLDKKNIWHEKSRCWHLRIFLRRCHCAYIWLKILLNGESRGQHFPFKIIQTATQLLLAHCWPLLEGVGFIQVAAEMLRRNAPKPITAGFVSIYHITFFRLQFHRHPQKSVMAVWLIVLSHGSNCLKHFRSLTISFPVGSEDIPNHTEHAGMILSRNKKSLLFPKGMWNHSQRQDEGIPYTKVVMI